MFGAPRWSLPLMLLALMAHRSESVAGPENMVLVINSNDPTSVEIGEYYQRLRQVPEGNVLRLAWTGGQFTIPLSEFREKLLRPILAFIRDQGLAPQITYVTYSTGFPPAIDYSAESPGQFSMGSLTGLTYLHELSLEKDAKYAESVTNGYYQVAPGTAVPESHGYPTPAEFAAAGQPQPNQVSRYLLSTMLGFTEGLGNSPAEIRAYLTSAAQADGTFPPGTIYLMLNSQQIADVPEGRRTKVRDKWYSEVRRQLERLGVKAQIDTGHLPVNQPDVAGLVVGTSNFQWRETRSRIVPGAICEHLTSFGGLMATGNGQTPLTEFLRHGAAGSCGTVQEPTSSPLKFPHPAIQVHYARGCTLAEAFYQSIASPYQILIVGDPLCRPWARIPEIELSELPRNDLSAHQLSIKISMANAGALRALELFVDGKFQGFAPVQEAITLSELPTGPHEIRLVGISQDAAMTRGRGRMLVTTP